MKKHIIFVSTLLMILPSIHLFTMDTERQEQQQKLDNIKREIQQLENELSVLTDPEARANKQKEIKLARQELAHALREAFTFPYSIFPKDGEIKKKNKFDSME